MLEIKQFYMLTITQLHKFDFMKTNKPMTEAERDAEIVRLRERYATLPVG